MGVPTGTPVSPNDPWVTTPRSQRTRPSVPLNELVAFVFAPCRGGRLEQERTSGRVELGS